VRLQIFAVEGDIPAQAKITCNFFYYTCIQSSTALKGTTAWICIRQCLLPSWRLFCGSIDGETAFSDCERRDIDWMNEQLDAVEYRHKNGIGKISDDKLLLKSIGVRTFGRVSITYFLMFMIYFSPLFNSVFLISIRLCNLHIVFCIILRWGLRRN